jgi:pimeloyl-ACP methyl ester carboxylesterase
MTQPATYSDGNSAILPPGPRPRRKMLAIVGAVALAVAAVAGLSLTGAHAAATRSSSAAVVSRLTSCQAPGRPKPTVVLVNGAWANASSWNGEVALLQEAGYPVRAIENPLQGLTTDSATVADFLKTISGPIVLVGHSYGGSVITNAAAGISNVKALVYVDAGAPDIGETTGQLSGSKSALNANPATWADMVAYPGAPAGAQDFYLKESVFIHSFGNDLPRSTDARLWATQGAASTAAFTTPSQAAAWKTIPSWYFISTGDKIITPQSELFMAHRAHSKITVFQGGSHLTLISHPAAVTAVIASAICSVR